MDRARAHWRRLAVFVAIGGGALICTAAPALAGGQGIVDGDFTNGLQGWTTVVVGHGEYSDYPKFSQDPGLHCFPAEVGNPFASIDVPDGADGYMQQRLTVPTSHDELSVLTWGNLQAVTATIDIVTTGTDVHVLQRYTPPQLQAAVGTVCSGLEPVTYTFDLSAYAGKTVALRFQATSAGYDGTIVNFDDVGFTEPPPAGSVAAPTTGSHGTPGVVGRQAPTTSASAPLATGNRSTIASALVPIDKAFPLTWRTGLNVVIALGVMLLVTFPAQLFNKTLDENYDEIRDIARRRLPMLVWLRRYARRLGDGSGRNAFLLVMVVGAILGGLNDPGFGFNTKSVESFVAVVLAFTAGVVVSSRIAYEYRHRRKIDTTWKWHARPAGLLAAAVCMVISRLSHFEPGYLYGVIAGVSFTVGLGRKEQGHDVALGTLGTLALAVVSWAVWTPIGSLAAEPHPLFLVLVLDTVFAGLFVSGIVGTVINLVPLQFLPGAALARWHKGVWSAVTALSLFLLIQVMLLPAARSSRLGDAPFVTTVVLFVVFGAASIGANRYFAARRKVRDAGTPPAVAAAVLLGAAPMEGRPVGADAPGGAAGIPAPRDGGGGTTDEDELQEQDTVLGSEPLGPLER